MLNVHFEMLNHRKPKIMPMLRHDYKYRVYVTFVPFYSNCLFSPLLSK